MADYIYILGGSNMKEGQKAFEELVETIKKHAMESYSKGGDVMIECWDKDDFLKFIVECAMYSRDPFTCATELFSLWHGQAMDVRCHIEDEYRGGW
jgi:hypothetical protein